MATNHSEGTCEEGVEEALPSYIKEKIDCEELFLKNGHKQIKSLWVKVRDWGKKGSLAAADHMIKYVDSAHEVFFLQLQVAWWSQVLNLVACFNHPDIYWKISMASCQAIKEAPGMHPG